VVATRRRTTPPNQVVVDSATVYRGCCRGGYARYRGGDRVTRRHDRDWRATEPGQAIWSGGESAGRTGGPPAFPVGGRRRLLARRKRTRHCRLDEVQQVGAQITVHSGEAKRTHTPAPQRNGRAVNPRDGLRASMPDRCVRADGGRRHCTLQPIVITCCGRVDPPQPAVKWYVNVLQSPLEGRGCGMTTIQQVVFELTTPYAGRPYHVSGHALFQAIAGDVDDRTRRDLQVSHGIFTPSEYGSYPESHSQKGYAGKLGGSLPPVESYEDLFLFRDAATDGYSPLGRVTRRTRWIANPTGTADGRTRVVLWRPRTPPEFEAAREMVRPRLSPHRARGRAPA